MNHSITKTINNLIENADFITSTLDNEILGVIKGAKFSVEITLGSGLRRVVNIHIDGRPYAYNCQLPDEAIDEWYSITEKSHARESEHRESERSKFYTKFDLN